MSGQFKLLVGDLKKLWKKATVLRLVFKNDFKIYKLNMDLINGLQRARL